MMSTPNIKSFSVLFFSTFDSMNYWMPPVIEALKKKGHNYRIIVRDESDFLNNKMFAGNDFNISASTDVSTDIVDDFDFVVLPPIYIREFTKLIDRVIEKDIFTISSSYLFSSIVMRCYPDIVLTFGQSKFAEFHDNGLDYSCIAIGNPQYDNIANSHSDQREIKNVLVIDQGGYPYGSVGKKQFADTIMQMAIANPFINFTLKPRYTKAEIGSGQTTHQLSESLSDFLIDTIPNLNILEKPVILEEIIQDYDAMISTWSTAFYAAMAARMPQLILEGFDSIDVFDVRNFRIAQAYNHLQKSGVVKNYKEIDFKNLQFGCLNEDFVTLESEQPYNPSAPAIIDLLEFLYANLVMPEQRILDTFQCPADDFYNKFVELHKVDRDTPRYHYWNNLRFQLNLVMQEAVYQNRSMCNRMNLSELQNFVRTCRDTFDSENPVSYYVEQANFIVAKAKEQLFTSKEILSWMDGDLILQDFYADWLYETKQYKQLTQPAYPFQIKGSLNYYQALIALPKHKFRAMKLLFAFLDELFSRNNVLVFLKERRLAQSMIPFYSGINKLFLFYYLIVTKKYIVFAYLNEGAVANSPIMTFFKLKYLIQSNQKQTAAVTYQRFMHKFDGSQNKKIFNKIMILFMKLEYKKNKNEF